MSCVLFSVASVDDTGLQMRSKLMLKAMVAIIASTILTCFVAAIYAQCLLEHLNDVLLRLGGEVR
jgi:putative effector of murein hydrolase LrgA (UPF0299 family)